MSKKIITFAFTIRSYACDQCYVIIYTETRLTYIYKYDPSFNASRRSGNGETHVRHKF